MKLRLYENLDVSCTSLIREMKTVGRILEKKEFPLKIFDSVCAPCLLKIPSLAEASLKRPQGALRIGKLGFNDECPEIEEAVKHLIALNALADFLEALIGAVYLDSRGCLDTVLAVVRWMGMDLDGVPV